MKNEESKISRKKFVGWLGVLSLFATVGAAFRTKSNKKPKTIKMLTQDGKLVEIDASLLADNAKKLSNTELQNWVSRK